MKRQFEKVLNDFQPGLLQSLAELNEESDSDEQVYMLYVRCILQLMTNSST